MLHIACMAPMSDGITYPDFSSCVLAGTKVANELIINNPSIALNTNNINHHLPWVLLFQK